MSTFTFPPIYKERVDCSVFSSASVAGVPFLSTSIHSFRLNATGSCSSYCCSNSVVRAQVVSSSWSTSMEGWLCLVRRYICWGKAELWFDIGCIDAMVLFLFLMSSLELNFFVYFYYF